MQIYGPTHVHGAQQLSAPHSARSTDSARPSFQAGGDTVEISSAGNLADKLAQLPDIRADRVASIRQALADGVYETSDKLDIALDRLLDEIG